MSMKYFLMALTMGALCGCSQDEAPEAPTASVPLRISAAIDGMGETRVLLDEDGKGDFTEGDEITVEASNGGSAIYTYTAVDDSHTLEWQSNAPLALTTNELTYRAMYNPLNGDDLEATTTASLTNPDATFLFKHTKCKVAFKFISFSLWEYTTVTCSVRGLDKDYIDLPINDGSLELYIEPTVVDVIVVDVTVYGVVYRTSITPTSKNFESGKSYNYTVDLSSIILG
jgi:hypothetical protein